MPTMTTHFGTSGVAGYDSSHLNFPQILRIDAANNLYVLETNGSDPPAAGRIRKITPAGVESTFASTPYISTFDVVGPDDVIWANAGAAPARLTRVTGGSTTTLGGDPASGYVDGALATAKFQSTVRGLAVRSNGDIYLGDFSPGRVRLISGATVSTLAGNTSATTVDGTGTGASFSFVFPDAVIDADDNYWVLTRVSAGSTHLLRKCTPGGVVTTEFTFNGPAIFNGPTLSTVTDVTALCVAADGNLYVVAEVDLSLTVIVQIQPATSTALIVHQWSQDTGGSESTPSGIVADSLGNLYVSIFNGATRGHTIQKISGVFTPPPSNPPMSTLTDPSPTVDPAKWSTIGPVASVAGALQLGDDITTGYATSANLYDFDRAEVKLNAAGRGMQLWVDADDSTDSVKIVIHPDTWIIRGEWSISGSSGDTGDGVTYDVDAHRYLKLVRFTDTESVAFNVSADGIDWDTLGSCGVPNTSLTTAKAIIVGNLATAVDDFNIPATAPVDPTDPDTLPDPFDPDAEAPPSGTDPDTLPPGSPLPEPTCATVLDLIREFSSLVKRPVRITGPSTIEMVDINTPLPTGWTVADADDLYHTASHELTAGAKVLSLDSGLLSLAVAADLVTNDIRLLTSDWQLPHQLPIFGLVAGLVARVSFTASPTAFRASVTFAVQPVPLAARRS